MIPSGGYMYVVDGQQQRGSHLQGFGGHFHHGYPSHPNFNVGSNDGQPRFFPVAANMPVGEDVDRFYQLNSDHYHSWRQDPRNSETTSTTSKVSKHSVKNNRDSGVSVADEEKPAQDDNESRKDENNNPDNNNGKFRRSSGKFNKNQVISYTSNKFNNNGYNNSPQYVPVYMMPTYPNQVQGFVYPNGFMPGGRRNTGKRGSVGKVNYPQNRKNSVGFDVSYNPLKKNTNKNGKKTLQINKKSILKDPRKNSHNSDCSHEDKFSHDSGLSHKGHETNSCSNSLNDTSEGGKKLSLDSGDTETKSDSVTERKTSLLSENSESNFLKPCDELVNKIVDLITFYLSDEYLSKDKYLLRQIRCKSEGYISIKLMTSFKKVKKLSRDWRVVRYALMQSDKLVISPEGYRVRRNSALPEALRKPRLLSSVVAIRIPDCYNSVEAITGLFRQHGEIDLVRLLRPGKDIPSDLRNYATQVPDIGKSLCAVVDFEESEAALTAVRLLKETVQDTGMRLALLGPRVRRTLYKQDKPDEENEELEKSPAPVQQEEDDKKSEGGCSCSASDCDDHKKRKQADDADTTGSSLDHDQKLSDDKDSGHINSRKSDEGSIKTSTFIKPTIVSKTVNKSNTESSTIEVTLQKTLVSKIGAPVHRQPYGPQQGQGFKLSVA